MCFCECCCNTASKKCYQMGIIFVSFFIIIFQMVLCIFVENSIKPEEIETFIFSERPLFDFEISDSYIYNKKNITFFEFKGRQKREGNKTITYDKKTFTKILGNEFFYDGKDRNYFDYKNKYSVPSGQSCATNYKKCGILDSEGRILCLPNDEECPLNGFLISDKLDENGFDGVSPIQVTDNFNYKIYYVYFTNKNTDDKIITDFKLSHGSPCAQISEINWIKYYDNEIQEDFHCSTYVNGNLNNARYTKASEPGIKITSLYKDNELYDEPDASEFSDVNIDLYVRNYNDMDESCVQGFLDDLNGEKTYYESISGTVRALSAISLGLISTLAIYMICSCCYDLAFKAIAIAVPIYGIVVNIITIGITNKTRIRYKCQIEGFNEAIDELVDEQYDNNNTVNIIMAAFSIAFYIIVLIFTICLKMMKPRNMVGGYATSVQVQPVYPQYAQYPQQYQTPYGAPPNMVYQNAMVPPPSSSYGVAYK